MRANIRKSVPCRQGEGRKKSEKRENQKETGEGERRKRGERKETEEEERGEEKGKRGEGREGKLYSHSPVKITHQERARPKSKV